MGYFASSSFSVQVRIVFPETSSKSYLPSLYSCVRSHLTSSSKPISGIRPANLEIASSLSGYVIIREVCRGAGDS